MLTSDTSGKQAIGFDPDTMLMIQVSRDDDAAFEELVSRYKDRVLSLLFNQLGVREEAEDVTQEVFLRVFKARKRYEPRAKFSTWLFTITNNLASNVRRARRTRKSVELEARDSGPLGPRPAERLLHDPNPEALDRLEDGEIAAVVRDAVARLNDRQRMAVLLSKFEDMSYAEIGQVMQLSESAVKSLMTRARSRLKKLLADYLSSDAN